MNNPENDNYYENQSRNDKGVLGSFQILFIVIFLLVLIYLHTEYGIFSFVWEIFLQ